MFMYDWGYPRTQERRDAIHLEAAVWVGVRPLLGLQPVRGRFETAFPNGQLRGLHLERPVVHTLT